MMDIVKHKIKAFHGRFTTLKGNPKHIAMGMAIGVFIGMTPTIPFHTALVVMVGIFFKQNITAGCLGTIFISNPLTIPIFYFLQYELGYRILGSPPREMMLTDYSLGSIWGLGSQIFLPLLTGGILMASIFAVPAYFIAHHVLKSVRRQRCP